MISVQPVKLCKTCPTSDNMCIHSQSSSSKLRQTTSFLSAYFPSLLPLAFYFYSFPHSSTLFLSTLVLFFLYCWALSPSDPETEQYGWKPTSKICFLFILSFPFTLMRGKPHWAVCYSKYLAIFSADLSPPPTVLPPPPKKSFIPFSPHIFFQFQDIEHEKDSIMIEEVENGKRGVSLTKKAMSTE